MTTSEIQGKINYYSGCVSDCEARMSELNSKIDRANQVYDALSAYKNKAGELNDARKTKLSGAVSTSYESKTLDAYYEGMNGMLTGAGFTNAYDGLESGCAEVQAKIGEWTAELSSVTGERNANAASKSYWEGQLSNADDKD